MKILLVDDHIMFREGLVSLLRSQPGVEVVGEASTVGEAIQSARATSPDIILMDFGLPDGDGTEATQAILADNPDGKIVFLTIYDTDERLFAAIRSGAKGYLLKNTPVNKLLAALRSLERDEAALSRSMTSKILIEFSRSAPGRAASGPLLSSLTLREMEVLQELTGNATNREIAQRLALSETTVKNHIHNILNKLHLKNRRDVARFSRQHGLGNIEYSLPPSHPETEPSRARLI